MKAAEVQKSGYLVRLFVGAIFALMGTIAGAVILYMAVPKLWNSATLSLTGYHADGTIVHVISKFKKANKVLIQYKRHDGREAQFITVANSNIAQLETVPIIYLKNPSNSASIDTWRDLWLGGVILFAAGIGFLLISIVIVGTLRQEKAHH